MYDRQACFLIGWLFFVVPFVSIAATELHVSLRGDDANAGSSELPFRTLSHAQSAVRQLVARGLDDHVTVYLHAGTYELSNTLVFGPQDSGSERFAIRYEAAPGEQVMVSGGRHINHWKKMTRGLWTAQVPADKQGKWFFRLLVVDDRRAHRARWPDEDGVLHIRSSDDTVKQFTFDRPLLGDNLANQSTELVVFQNWSVTRGLVEKSNPGQLTTVTAMGWIGHGPATTTSPGKTAYLEHALEFLDQPDEWFLDGNTGALYYFPSQPEFPEQERVVAPALDQLIQVAGTKKHPVSNLHFHGIHFAHSRFAIPEIGYNEIQAAHYGSTLTAPTFVQPVAIECTYTDACSFENCRVAHVNSSGIGFGPGCRDCALRHCTIEDIGGTGIVIGWRGKGNLKNGKEGKLDADWADPADAPTDIIVSNCTIRRCGSDSFGGTGIFVAYSRATQIQHNLVHDLPYTGISVGYRWNTSPTSQTECLVDSNHIHDVMKKLADGGGIYTLGFQPGTIFRNNHIHHVHRSNFAHGGAPNNGFFIDEGSKGFLFDSNVVHSTSGTPVRLNNCQREWHTWQANLFGDQAAKSPRAKAIISQSGIKAAKIP